MDGAVKGEEEVSHHWSERGSKKRRSVNNQEVEGRREEEVVGPCAKSSK